MSGVAAESLPMPPKVSSPPPFKVVETIAASDVRTATTSVFDLAASSATAAISSFLVIEVSVEDGAFDMAPLTINVMHEQARLALA